MAKLKPPNDEEVSEVISKDDLEDMELDETSMELDETSKDTQVAAVPIKVEELPQTLDPLKQYFKEISQYPILSLEEEMDLVAKLQKQGDLSAAKRLVTANLRLVVKIAMEYYNAYQNLMDLIQEGNIGLMKAVSKFDPTKGARLSYYAGWWIRSYILKYILDNFRLVRVGTTRAQKKLFFHLIREKEKLEAQGLQLGPKLLADKYNVREEDVIEMDQRLGHYGAEVSLNVPIGSDSLGDAKAFHQDMLLDPSNTPDETLVQEELKSILKEKIEQFAQTLKNKELLVFRERLAAERPKTLQEIADVFSMTRERVRQIEVKVIEKLQKFYKKYIR